MQIVKNELLFLEINQKSHEVQLLTELSHEIMNFSEGFRSNAKKTFVLSPWASSLFGLEIFNGKIYLGIPAMLYDILCKTRIYNINYIKNSPGLFLIINIGSEPDCQPIALRVNVRSSRVSSAAMFKKITLIKMNTAGESIPGFDENEFELDIKSVEKLDWEKFNSKI
jgi:hypothetical protein